MASGSGTKHNAMMYVPTFYTILICKFSKQLTSMVTELWYKSTCIHKTMDIIVMIRSCNPTKGKS